MSLARRAVAAVTAMAAAGSIVLGVAAPASADLYRDGFFRIAYNGQIWQVDVASDTYQLLEFDEWAALGFPHREPALTEVVKYPWSATLYAVTFLGDERDEWVWDTLDYAEWERAGFPAPRNAGWIEGSSVYKWYLSDEIFLKGPDGVLHKLTYAEWLATEPVSPPPVNYSGWFVKYSFDPTIIRITNADGLRPGGYALFYDEWRDLAFPTPSTVQSLYGDELYRYEGDPTIWFDGLAILHPLTWDEWAAMGFPEPEVRAVQA